MRQLNANPETAEARRNKLVPLLRLQAENLDRKFARSGRVTQTELDPLLKTLGKIQRKPNADDVQRLIEKLKECSADGKETVGSEDGTSVYINGFFSVKELAKLIVW